ncbi:hypothetical protein CQY20_25620 [Mycolicibacterium agri]|uniref:Uncharacterized protein n=1 Tax=Mycolicibacterium agri TaxID=36811 RepID=A0A2A7MSD6_MYCAG|nr:hypothetical protein [Mycolicibacterium agri]PEG34413.1 hypothetical protein CQY20_25620 [Mycolicibacterium agri]GFG49963.1 hypothetical protein MAGR_14040 [Mycolicibacterium agri]
MNTQHTPRDAVAAVLTNPVLPDGDDERFAGFGVMGLPFESGHYLALRQFPTASFAPAYLSVWHRDPAGNWTFYATTPAEQSCARYFSSATDNEAVQCDIDIEWVTPWWFRVTIPGLLQWSVHVESTFASRMLSALADRLPESAWTNRSALGVIGRVAGTMLGAGDIRLAGAAPNGQRFMVAPRKVWAVAASRAVLGGEDLGPIGRLPQQARLADFRPPQTGICVIGTGHFENFDETVHVAAGDTARIG